MAKLTPNLVVCSLSRMVAAYPFERGKTYLRRITKKWLVGRLPFGPWIRVSGAVDAEWNYLQGEARESATTQFVKSFLIPGMTFVDVGANIGYFTLLAASLGARVIAYEPTPTIFERLRENVTLNSFGDVSIVNVAIMHRPGIFNLYQSPEDPEANNLFGQGDCPVEVAAVRLDDELGERGVQKIDLLKIDAEGAELLVLAGATKLLRAAFAPVIIIEVNPVALRVANSEPADVLSFFRENGYQCHELEQVMYKGEPVSNILAIPAHARVNGMSEFN